MEYCKIIGNKKYEVHLDDTALITVDYWDWASEEDKLAYIKRHIDGELCFYMVIEKIECECCKQFKWNDTLGGIDESSPEKALIQYLGHIEF